METLSKMHENEGENLLILRINLRVNPKGLKNKAFTCEINSDAPRWMLHEEDHDELSDWLTKGCGSFEATPTGL